MCDGGLLTISRYPIVSSENLRFETPGVCSDSICDRGLIYTKIDISSNLQEGFQQHLHVFQTHVQASYFDINAELYVETFVSRYN